MNFTISEKEFKLLLILQKVSLICTISVGMTKPHLFIVSLIESLVSSLYLSHLNLYFSLDDIAIRQFILLNGRYKLNDFNTARPLYWNSKVNAVCPDVTNRFVDKNRSPEEMRDEINYVNEKIDVYSLGNIFYKLIMNEVSVSQPIP